MKFVSDFISSKYELFEGKSVVKKTHFRNIILFVL